MLVEVLNEQGIPCRPGKIGRLVITDLHNFAAPLVRYAMGDYAEAGGACSCGRGLPVVKRVLGRARNVLMRPGGGHMWPIISKTMIGIPGLRQAQLVQRRLDEVTVRMVVAAPLTAAEEEGTRQAFDDALNNVFAVRLEYVGFDRALAGGQVRGCQMRTGAGVMSRVPENKAPRGVAVPRSALTGIGWPALPTPADSALLALNYQLEQSQWWPPKVIESMQLKQAEHLLVSRLVDRALLPQASRGAGGAQARRAVSGRLAGHPYINPHRHPGRRARPG